MNQYKMGEFLKQLRKEKNLTQEELAKKLYTSSRTISRWETGKTLPDLNSLIELADFYDVDIREIIDGERKRENMDQETKETLQKIAEYAEEENKRLNNRLSGMLIASALMLILSALLCSSGVKDGLLVGILSEDACNSIGDFSQGFTVVTIFIYIMRGKECSKKIRQWKRKLINKNKK